MLVPPVNRIGQWNCECMFIQRAEVGNGHVSAGECRDMSCAEVEGVQLHAESRAVQWFCECREVQSTVGQWACE